MMKVDVYLNGKHTRYENVSEASYDDATKQLSINGWEDGQEWWRHETIGEGHLFYVTPEDRPTKGDLIQGLKNGS